MLFVGLYRGDRARDREFWGVLWQGQGPPPDFELVAAYNLMTDLRVLIFRADSIQSIRFLDRLNLVGSFECHPALDQTDGYAALFARDLEHFERFMRGRGASDQVTAREVGFRRRAMESASAWHALALGRAWQEQPGDATPDATAPAPPPRTPP